MLFKSQTCPLFFIIAVIFFSQLNLGVTPLSAAVVQEKNKEAGTVRFATFNISFNRDKEGLLENDWLRARERTLSVSRLRFKRFDRMYCC